MSENKRQIVYRYRFIDGSYLDVEEYIDEHDVLSWSLLRNKMRGAKKYPPVMGGVCYNFYAIKSIEILEKGEVEK